MKCYIKNSKDEIITSSTEKHEISKELEKEILEVCKNWRIYIESISGFDAENDNGLYDLDDDSSYEELNPDCFITYENQICGYFYTAYLSPERNIPFTGKENLRKITVYSKDSSNYGSSTSYINKEGLYIEKR